MLLPSLYVPTAWKGCVALIATVGFTGATAIDSSVTPSGVTTRERARVCTREALSATCTVKLEVPTVVGTPVMTPEEDSAEKPGGREPETRDQV